MNEAPTLRRFAGRCPPRGLGRLGSGPASALNMTTPTLHRRNKDI